MKRSVTSEMQQASVEAERTVKREQERLLLAHTEIGVLVATAFAALMAFSVFQGHIAKVDPWLVTTWFIVKVAVVLPRLITANLARSSNLRTADRASSWTLPLLAVDGAVWGIASAHLMNGPVESFSYVAAAMASVSCVATFGLQVRLAATAAYCVPMLLPMAAVLLSFDSQPGLVGGLGLLMLIGLLLSTARRSERRTIELIELRLQSEQLAIDKQAALAEVTRHSDAKNRFLSIVSHELRTPLHGILGLTKLTLSDLPNTPLTAMTLFRLGQIRDAGNHLKRMVDDLLDISLIEGGRLQLRPLPFNLLHELSIVSAAYQERANEVGVSFKAYLQPSLLGFVMGDGARVTQVLHNLLANAFKFTPWGGQITLEVERISETSSVQFVVRDTGPGVAEIDRIPIFEIFEQGNQGDTRPGGVGIGLAISRQLARQMGGDVVYRPGGLVGSAFVFTANLPQQTIAEHSDAPEIAATLPKSAYSALTIYLAEDDPTSSLVAATVIRSLGCYLEDFSDGKALLERFKGTSTRPHVIVLDWDMPTLNGYDTTLAIRAHEARNNLKPVTIICLTANPAPTFKMAGKKAGMNALLTKPCAPHELAAALSENIGREIEEAELQQRTDSV